MYEEILYLPHHVSSRRRQMSMRDRAAQFAPFAALSGQDNALTEMVQRVEKFYNTLNRAPIEGC